MPNELVDTITSHTDSIRNRSIHSLLHGVSSGDLFRLADEVEVFRKTSGNLYHRVRACLFLSVIYRFYLANNPSTAPSGTLPYEGVRALFERDFERSIDIFLSDISRGNENATIFSAAADAYYKLSFQYLLNEVKSSMSNCRENDHLYSVKGLDDYPFSVPPELTTPDGKSGLYPVGSDASPVRLDPSHSGWSDIFFLGMDFPEGARVINISVNLRRHGSGDPLAPPCECYCRFIEEPAIHLLSVDLKKSIKVTTIQELFNFGSDHLSLLKAGVVASGVVPPCFEHKGIPLRDILKTLLRRPGGIEIVTRVNNIPKGSRLAVSTTLLATIITRLMRFSGQIGNLTGPLQNNDRRVVASRAVLGEWLGGSGGGWQDSGGLWPGIKIIAGRLAGEGDPELGKSRGCLLPEHTLLSGDEISGDVEKRILDSLVLVHGGISQDVGPILEMVTEKYLLKHEREWDARLKGIRLFDDIVAALKSGDMRELGRLTTEDWEGPIQNIIPWVNNAFTDDLIRRVRDEFRGNFWGFLMLGGMSGGGMAFIVDPSVKCIFMKRIYEIMQELKQKYLHSLPFIIDPVVYDFEINHEGIVSKLCKGRDAVMPEIGFPPDTPSGPGRTGPSDEDLSVSGNTGTNSMRTRGRKALTAEEIKIRYGFDRESHERMKSLLKKGDIGLAKNRLPLSAKVEDASHGDMYHFEDENAPALRPSTGRAEGRDHIPTGIESTPDQSLKALYRSGLEALKNRGIAVVTFAGGMGSRWTHGSEVVKPINPFIRMDGRYRTFVEIHLAKSRRTGLLSGYPVPHVFTTSYLTHDAIASYLAAFDHFSQRGHVYLSEGRAIGHRVYPMARDLRFFWEEQMRQKMADNVQRVLDDSRRALTEWTRSHGEGEDYCENRPLLRFNPPGHWHEIPNMIRNGVLAEMIRDNPSLNYLLCHNIDTLGAHIDPVLLGMHIAGSSCMTFEVIPRRIEDAGGGLAKIDGHLRLIEGIALPREADEYALSYYNTLTTWITIDALLGFFGLDRDTILGAEASRGAQHQIHEALQCVEQLMPVYVTIKNVKYIWGNGQEDVYPVAQFERLWGDMTGLKEMKAAYVAVSRYRGLQLKDPSLLDTWVNDGSFEYVKTITSF